MSESRFLIESTSDYIILYLNVFTDTSRNPDSVQHLQTILYIIMSYEMDCKYLQTILYIIMSHEMDCKHLQTILYIIMSHEMDCKHLQTILYIIMSHEMDCKYLQTILYIIMSHEMDCKHLQTILYIIMSHVMDCKRIFSGNSTCQCQNTTKPLKASSGHVPIRLFSPNVTGAFPQQENT